MKLHELHERIAAQIVGVLATPAVPGPWTESRHPYGAFLDAPEVEHHGFALWFPDTESLLEDRQRADRGTRSKTTILIRWAHVIRVEAAVLDTKDGLRAEHELTAAVKATEGLPLLFEDAKRETLRDGLLMVGEQRWTLFHPHLLS